MRKFKSMDQAQRFLGAHAAVYNLFNLGRLLMSAENYRYFRLRALIETTDKNIWSRILRARSDD